MGVGNKGEFLGIFVCAQLDINDWTVLGKESEKGLGGNSRGKVTHIDLIELRVGYQRGKLRVHMRNHFNDLLVFLFLNFGNMVF